MMVVIKSEEGYTSTRCFWYDVDAWNWSIV
jgi:hypothetical protein